MTEGSTYDSYDTITNFQYALYYLDVIFQAFGITGAIVHHFSLLYGSHTI